MEDKTGEMHEGSGSGDKGGENKGEAGSAGGGRKQTGAPSRSSGDAVSHHPGFVDCKLIMRTCVELCYSLPHHTIHIIL